ncbi:MAG TPA: sigma-70 family RNA polymerase sigma factor [Bacteroidia bacterium]|nr:sigma-70 family RNA polymerase sigma factor [Bacteroidia bacterium]OQB60091.1 MAG: ECF RNA polymerase sigma factor SigW [Bacteroidetes bacterium ADurb.Bin141]QQR93973.1 MAG: sigma-70 family RNA polymerase sigma factor [Bacteroidota bacterium]MBP7713324.1 sigma-70 family RNA polymerase sigma factor [Bacteroidia bacterium]MBP8667770.1 sigma-70 family RNA polymerase sigma factor [Bacteroidia bacterium]
MWLIRNKDKNALSDEELVLQYRQQGDKQAVGILFNRYSHLVFGVCMKYLKDTDDSKDAVLQIFEKLYADLSKHDVQKFSYWIHRVAQNFCLMQLRSRQAAKNRADNYSRDEIAASTEFEPENTDRVYEKETELLMLEEAIKTLNEEQRICIELFFLKEKCYNEITDLTGFDFKQVKSFIQNGKRNLRIYMEKNNHVKS